MRDELLYCMGASWEYDYVKSIYDEGPRRTFPEGVKIRHMANAEYQFAFTIFTPTYNRADLLPRVYASLARQTYKDFEWLIVDDGSTDGTAEIVESFTRVAPFPIRYVWKPNGGVHTAVNKGVDLAQGKFFAILDSDDWYVDDALEKMLEFWDALEDVAKDTCSGVCGLCAYENGDIVGSRFPHDVWDSDDFEAKNVYGIEGDKKGFKRTDVMRQFPFPEDVGRFVPESTVWNRVGNSYSTRFVNRVFALVEYQAGGLSDKSRINAIRNSKARLLALSELLNCGRRLPLRVFFRSTVNLLRSALHAQIPLREVYNSVPSKISMLPCLPVAVMLVLRDRIFLRRR